MVARVKLVLNGSIGNPAVEEWSVGFNFSGLGVGNLTTSTELQDFAEDAFAIFTNQTLYPVLHTWVSTAASFVSCSAYYYPGPGPAVAVGESSGAAESGSGSASKPPQVSVVGSLLTGLSGRSFRGRVYWPGLGAAVSSTTLRMAGADAQAGADELADILTAIAAAGSGVDLIFPGVYSPTREVITPVSQISVGDVLDTQRRRREGLTETRYAADVG